MKTLVTVTGPQPREWTRTANTLGFDSPGEAAIEAAKLRSADIICNPPGIDFGEHTPPYGGRYSARWQTRYGHRRPR